MTLKIQFLLVAVLVAAVQSAVLKNGAVIPTYAPVCKRSQNDFDDCLRSSIQVLIRKISKDGIRKLNIPSLDPWHVKDLSLSYGVGKPFKISVASPDFDTYGFSRLQILGVRSNFDDPEKMTLDVDFYNKKIYVEGTYAAEGIVADVPIVAKGKYNVSLTDVSGTFKLRGHLVNRDGQEFLQVDRATMAPDLGDVKLNMNNENEKYKELSNLFVVLINQFWKVMYQEMLPIGVEEVNKVMTPVINLATLKIPFNQLVPL